MLAHLGILCLFAQLVFSIPATSKHSYDGYKVLQIQHKTEEDFRKILAMEAKFELDFWKWPRHLNDTALVNIAPHHLEQFLAELKEINTDVSSFIEDVQQVLDENYSEQIEQKHNKRAVSSSRSGIDLYAYHRHGSIRQYLNLIAGSVLPNGITAEITDIGQSYEGRSIEVIKLSSSAGDVNNKRSIFIDGGIHAREWIAPATVIYFIENLIFNPDTISDVDNVLHLYNIHLLPVVNPDGYEYTTVNRLWRKNRSNPSSSTCYGVDLNRNFPFKWNPSVGGSTSPCSDVYSGPAAASELETQHLLNYLEDNKVTMDAYLTIHSYGQMWLYPWGYTSDLSVDWQDLDSLARYATRHLRMLYGTAYTVGSATRTLYSAAGGSDDFAKGGCGIKYSYTLELRDKGHYGFTLPESLIRPTCEETFYGFLKFALKMNEIESSKI